MATRCRNCPENIEQLPSGTWISSVGQVYCQSTMTGRDVTPRLHIPQLQEDWIRNIQALARINPTVWTPIAIARLMGVPEDQILEILDA